MTTDNINPQESKWIQTLQEMTSQLSEGGPDVVVDDLVGYVHQILPDEIEQQVRLNIVTYQSWYAVYRDVLKEKIYFDKLTESEDKTRSTPPDNWITIWNQHHNRHSLPMPTQEETACLTALAGESGSKNIRHLFQSLGDRANISNIVQLQLIAEIGVQQGFLASEECEVEQSEESTEHALRAESDNQPNTELAFQLAQPPEELLASICQQLLNNKALTEEIKQSLLTLSEGLLQTQPLRDSFADWLSEL